MSVTLRLNGAQDLARQLADLPRQLKHDELGPIVSDAADGMVTELKGTYARRTGTLADRVASEGTDSPLAVRVRSRAPHAHLYEYGTVRRFTKGTGAGRGQMPAQPTFKPAAARWRRRMYDGIKQRLAALRVPGFTGTLGARES
jgi:hypothetical protein